MDKEHYELLVGGQDRIEKKLDEVITRVGSLENSRSEYIGAKDVKTTLLQNIAMSGVVATVVAYFIGGKH